MRSPRPVPRLSSSAEPHLAALVVQALSLPEGFVRPPRDDDYPQDDHHEGEQDRQSENEPARQNTAEQLDLLTHAGKFYRTGADSVPADARRVARNARPLRLPGVQRASLRSEERERMPS